jgi:hypothetical protein
MSQAKHTGPTRQERSRRTHLLRERGLTWEQIADVWEADYPEIGPRVAFRWAHNLTHQDVAERWNVLDPGEPTMTKSRIYEFEVWPQKGRRPSVRTLRMLARIFETTARRLLPDSEYACFDQDARVELDKIDHRHLDDNFWWRQDADSDSAIPLVFGPERKANKSRPDSLTVVDVELLLRRFYRLDDEFGGDDLCSVIAGHTQDAIRLFKTRSFNTNESARLHRAVGGLTQMGGWLSIDANRHADATRYLTTSLYTAYEAEDLNLASHVLGYMSLHALYRGRSREALSLGSTATSLAAASGTPRTQAILSTRTARAYAHLGKAD